MEKDATPNIYDDKTDDDTGGCWKTVIHKRRIRQTHAKTQPSENILGIRDASQPTVRKRSRNQNLPQLPLHDEKIILRPHGGLCLDKWTRPELASAPWSAAGLTTDDRPDIIFRLRPQQNLAIISTPQSHVADALYKIKEALNLFFEKQKAYEVKPTHVMFTLLIGGCGRVGYTKMAFKLYKMMRDRGLEPTPATLTGLFNSCAESPYPEMGLEKARNLYEQIKLKNWVPSNLTYHAMIKAFGKCGDLDMAFRVMDEMADAKHAITTETFAFLLMACITDKEAGFSLGLKVMRTMLWKKIRPSVYCYNLFLRTVRECGVGPPEMFQELLLESLQPGKAKRISKKKGNAKADSMLRLEALLSDATSEGPTEAARFAQTEKDASERVFDTKEVEELPSGSSGKTATSASLATLPNLLSPSFKHTGEIVGLGKVTEPYHRLLMIGGVKGMMDHFRDMSVCPDAKTITLLLDCIPNNCDAEIELIAEADKIGVKLDVDFFNMLIKRRAFRLEKETAKDVLSMITARSLYPDVVTFGVLALTVHTKREGSEFLKTMQASSDCTLS
ncbi:pentatricopeptide repeat-containing protein 1, mitochondrial isoform X1 [Dermacentor andersoni]|uniref:pentatricopeptide repeat-containing protein 1, mitochondrial isoform X1 n=1 Tax=Dermacentor andersoni TaxID=34620 RepID=UPI002416A28C|nr:pentatricopeptide repeat-containing protein 1, mitochondrial-like isoform X1 [Dermacentor andersoni]